MYLTIPLSTKLQSNKTGIRKARKVYSMYVDSLKVVENTGSLIFIYK